MANINIPEANPVGSTGVSGVSPIKYTSRGTETGQAIQNLAGSLVNAGVTFAKVKQDVNTKEAKLFIDDRLKNATFELDQITSEEEVEDYTRSFVDSLNEEVHEKYGNKLGYKTIDMYNRQVQSEFQVKSRYKERGILVDKGRALTSTEIEQAVLNYDKEKVKQIAKSARDNGYINNVEMEKMQNQATYEIDINEAINISRDALEADPYLSIINSDNEILSAKSIEESLLLNKEMAEKNILSKENLTEKDKNTLIATSNSNYEKAYQKRKLAREIQIAETYNGIYESLEYGEYQEAVNYMNRLEESPEKRNMRETIRNQVSGVKKQKNEFEKERHDLINDKAINRLLIIEDNLNAGRDVLENDIKKLNSIVKDETTYYSLQTKRKAISLLSSYYSENVTTENKEFNNKYNKYLDAIENVIGKKVLIGDSEFVSVEELKKTIKDSSNVEDIYEAQNKLIKAQTRIFNVENTLRKHLREKIEEEPNISDKEMQEFISDLLNKYNMASLYIDRHLK